MPTSTANTFTAPRASSTSVKPPVEEPMSSATARDVPPEMLERMRQLDTPAIPRMLLAAHVERRIAGAAPARLSRFSAHGKDQPARIKAALSPGSPRDPGRRVYDRARALVMMLHTRGRYRRSS